MNASTGRNAPRPRLSTCLAAILLVPVVASCGSGPGKEQAKEAAPAEAVDVRAVKAVSATTGFLTVPGNVEAARSVAIASRIPGIIERLEVEEGARVRKGDLLVRLDGTELKAQVDAADAAASAASTHFERIKALHDRQAATRQELDEAVARNLSAGAAATGAKARLGYIELRAPFDGVIAEKNVIAGDLASPGAALLILQGTAKMRVAATLTQSQVRRIAIGRPLDAVLDDGATQECIVSVLSPGGEPGSRRFLVKCDLPEKTAARSGSFVRLRVEDETTGPSIMVPRETLIERGALTGLFVIEDGRARLRYISPGAAEGGSVVVRAGLATGEQVVLNPGDLADGAPVRVTLMEADR